LTIEFIYGKLKSGYKCGQNGNDIEIYCCYLLRRFKMARSTGTSISKSAAGNVALPPNTQVSVRRMPGDHNIGQCDLSRIRGIHWGYISGGVQVSFFNTPSVYGYVTCTDIVEGRVAHTGDHMGGCPHEIKVCILKKDNFAIYDCLKAMAGVRPPVSRAKPLTGNSCKVDADAVLQANGPMRETVLIDELVKIGHGRDNAKRVLKVLSKAGVRTCTKDPADGRFNFWS
jgi:hypothetical protein